MAGSKDSTKDTCEQVRQAFADGRALHIVCGDSKAFYGRTVRGEALSLRGHSGIVEYQPSELIVTVRSGTPLALLEQALAEQGQRLAFEPPHHSVHSSIGGVVACAMSGPSRAFLGSARDFVLGADIINGKGESLRFGGQVMKNVAGYDVSRLMVGAQGTLGVITRLSLKVLPLPEAEDTRVIEADIDSAHERLRELVHEGRPVSASCYYQGRLHIRLSGTANSVAGAAAAIGGETADASLWRAVRDQSLPLFGSHDLWRMSVPPAAPFSGDEIMVEWGGALRWRRSPSALFEQAAGLGGHATSYNTTGPGASRFHPLPPAMMALHRRIKQRFDPANILNPGRLYDDLQAGQ